MTVCRVQTSENKRAQSSFLKILIEKQKQQLGGGEVCWVVFKLLAWFIPGAGLNLA